MAQRNVLFLVTGMTPQIITETLWALACDPSNPEPWIPHEIQVLSTKSGLDQVRDRLFQQGNFAKLCEAYNLPPIKFDASCLHDICVYDDDNQPIEKLNDIKTPEDNEHAANAICQHIRELTSDDNSCLYVSIAGGRKTMGFYAGYALSLYGRAQDRLSHVLVHPDYENSRDFFFPAIAPEQTFVSKNEQGNTISLDAHYAKVWLADLPFVRMQEAIKDKHQLKQKAPFSKVVTLINESFNDTTLTFIFHDRKLLVNEKHAIELPPREYALLYWFAKLRKDGKAGIDMPKEDKPNQAPAEKAYIRELTDQYAEHYQELSNVQVTVDKKFIETVKSRLKDALIEQLGLELASKIQIKQDKRGTPFYLDLLPDAIRLVDNFQDTPI